MIASLTGRLSLKGRPLATLDLRIARGWSVLLGASGAGKSTLLRLLAGLPIAADWQGARHAPARIGWMAQGDQLQPRMSLAQNVGLMARLRGEALPDAQAALARVGLQGRGGEAPAALSGGERARVALARVLADAADLVLLDEPFAALDPLTRAQMQALAHARLDGRAVVMVTHDPLEALRLGDRIYLMQNQRLDEIPPLPKDALPPISDPSLALQTADLFRRMQICAG